MSSSQLSDVQFLYGTLDTGGAKPLHNVQAWAGGERIGQMSWNRREISMLEVNPEHQRQGVATGLWNRAHEVAAENPRVPAPRHSKDRTAAGDAWARAVGGRLPRRPKTDDTQASEGGGWQTQWARS